MSDNVVDDLFNNNTDIDVCSGSHDVKSSEKYVYNYDWLILLVFLVHTDNIIS